MVVGYESMDWNPLMIVVVVVKVLLHLEDRKESIHQVVHLDCMRASDPPVGKRITNEVLQPDLEGWLEDEWVVVMSVIQRNQMRFQ